MSEAGAIYSPRPGDAVWRIPDPGGFGFIFARGSDPGGAALPSGVLVRRAEGSPPPESTFARVWLLFGTNPRRVEAGAGAWESEFCRGRWEAWAERWGLSMTNAPSTVAALAGPKAFRWVRER